MITDEYEFTHDDFGPLEMLEHYFSAHGWTHERQSDDEVIAHFQGSWAQYELRAIWREEDNVLQFLALPDIRVSPDRHAVLYETLGLINEQLWIGHFEMWSTSGIVLFRHAVLLDDENETALSLIQAGTVVEAAIDECERFYPVFQFVLWANKKPTEAIAAALIETIGEA